jgi:hypothetical protein
MEWTMAGRSWGRLKAAWSDWAMKVETPARDRVRAEGLFAATGRDSERKGLQYEREA